METRLRLIISGCLACMLVFSACSSDSGDGPINGGPDPDPDKTGEVDRVDNFNFPSNGTSVAAKIWLPAEYPDNSDLPVIYLIDHCEYLDCVDEFQAAIDGVKSVNGFNALVVTLNDLIDYTEIDLDDYPQVRDVFNDLVAYVEAEYSDNSSRTVIGRGQAGRVVLHYLLFEDQQNVPFQNFIASDPSGLLYILGQIEDGNLATDRESMNLHISSTSSTDTDTDLNMDFINTLNEQALPWLEFEDRQYPGLIYPNAHPTVFADGLEYLFGS